MKRVILCLAAVSLAVSAAAQMMTTMRGVVKSFDSKTQRALVNTDRGLVECGVDAHVPAASLKPGVNVEMSVMTGFVFSATITKIVTDLPKPATAPAPTAPAPSPASTRPKGTVKTYDAATHEGTLTPATGGRDLYFSVDPRMKTDPKVGSKVSYVEVVVEDVEP